MDRTLGLLAALPKFLFLAIFAASVSFNFTQHRMLVRWQAAAGDLQVTQGEMPDGRSSYTIRRGDHVVCMIADNADSEDFVKAWGSDIGGFIGREDVDGDGAFDGGTAELQMPRTAFSIAATAGSDVQPGKTTVMARDRATDVGIVSIYQDLDNDGAFDVWNDRRAGKKYVLVQGAWNEVATIENSTANLLDGNTLAFDAGVWQVSQ